VFRGRCGPTVDAYSDASMSDHLIHGTCMSKDSHSDLVVYASVFEGPLHQPYLAIILRMSTCSHTVSRNHLQRSSDPNNITLRHPTSPFPITICAHEGQTTCPTRSGWIGHGFGRRPRPPSTDTHNGTSRHRAGSSG
jgi:hypothetical protein